MDPKLMNPKFLTKSFDAVRLFSNALYRTLITEWREPWDTLTKDELLDAAFIYFENIRQSKDVTKNCLHLALCAMVIADNERIKSDD
jgi:hypothetical protein